MEYVASYAFLINNKQEPSRENIMRVLKSLGASVSEESVELFISKVEGKSYEEIVSAGSALMASQRAASASSSASTTTAAKVEVAAGKEESNESESDKEMSFF